MAVALGSGWVGAGLGSWGWGHGHSLPYLAGSSPGTLGTCCVHPGWVTQPFACPHPHASMLPFAAVSVLRVMGNPDGWGDEISTCNSDARVYASLIRSNFCLHQSPMAPTLTPLCCSHGKLRPVGFVKPLCERYKTRWKAPESGKPCFKEASVHVRPGS